MGIEVTDVCMDKEADCVIVYSNGVSHDSDHETIPNHHDVAGSYVQQSVEDNTEVKEYEVKECTTENTFEMSGLSHMEKGKEEQNVVSSNPEAGLTVEKVKPEDVKTKDNNKSRLVVKHASKATAGNVRTKHTIPQPFALATEKRASNGTRPAAAEPTIVNKLSNSNSARYLNAKKHNQVISAINLYFQYQYFRPRPVICSGTFLFLAISFKTFTHLAAMIVQAEGKSLSQVLSLLFNPRPPHPPTGHPLLAPFVMCQNCKSHADWLLNMHFQSLMTNKPFLNWLNFKCFRKIKINVIFLEIVVLLN